MSDTLWWMVIVIGSSGSYAYANLTVDEVTTKLVVLGSGYKKYEAPSQAGEATEVFLDMSLMNVDPLSGAESAFGVLALVRLRWRDPRLNLSFYRKNTYLTLPAYLGDEIWTPQLAFLDASEARPLTATADHALRITRVSEDGTITDTRSGMEAPFLCGNSMALVLRGFRHTESTAQLRWISAYKSSAEDVFWPRGPRLLTVTIRTSEQTLESIAGPQRCLVLQFAFGRNPWPHLLSTWLPSAMLVPVAWARLWFPGGGLFLPCAALAGLTLHATQFKSQLRGYDLLTAMDVWLLLCLGFVLGAFLDHLMICNANQRTWSAQKLADDLAASDASRRSSEQVYVADGYRLTHEVATQTPLDAGLDEALHDRRARLVFVFGFPLVTLVYWAYYLAASH